MLNTLEVEKNKTAVWSDIPELRRRSANCFHVTNVWTGQDLGCIKTSYSAVVARHDTSVILVGESCFCL